MKAHTAINVHSLKTLYIESTCPMVFLESEKIRKTAWRVYVTSYVFNNIADM